MRGMKNTERKVTDKNFVDWEQHVFGYGYGTGEMPVLQALHDFMSMLENGRSYDYSRMEQFFGPIATWLLINVLCKADILDYGTSSRYGWLSEKGYRLRDYMSGKTVDQLYELVMAKNMDTITCFPDLCQCETGECPNPLF